MNFKELKEEWNHTPDKGILPDGVKARMWGNIEQATLKKRNRSYLWMAAASIIAALFITGYFYLQISEKEGINPMVVTTYRDDIRLLRLPDGTKVWVNQNTKIEYPESFDGNNRNVTLEGEAYFDVARNPEKPFIITSGTITTTVLGTSFNVSAYPYKNAEVHVKSGKVKVQGPNNVVFLERGYGAIQMPDGEKVMKTEVAAAEPAWKKTLIDIDGLTLGQVMVKLGKDYAFNIRYTDKNLSELKIKGTLDSRQGLEEMLNTIAFALDLTIKAEATNSYVISR